MNKIQHSVNKSSAFFVADLQKAAQRLAQSDVLVAQVRGAKTIGRGMLMCASKKAAA